ncbi:M48 family metallopeptidase [Anoxybacillus eryuanensis]|uniref:M48 family metallopeptidase n=1 Tax=Anoxybacillus eryuanensis TaxID=651866 RepID=UPI003EF14265
MPSFQYGKTTIDYTIEYKPKKRDVTITVEWLEGVKVIAPQEIDDSLLQSILYKRAPWMIDKWRALNEIANPPAPKEFVSGEKFAYLGRNYRLKVYKCEKPTLIFKQGKFLATIPPHFTEEERISFFQRAFKQWYIHHGEIKLQERLNVYGPKIGVMPTKIKLKEQKMRWGTCTNDGAIYLNWKIMMAPMPIIDYLLVHELAHIKYPNHSNDFWHFVKSVMSDYEQRKEWLRVNGPTLTL